MEPSAEVQAEARRRGLIPDLPATQAGGIGGVRAVEGNASAKSLADGVRDVVGILRSRPAPGSDGSDGWDRMVRIVAEEGSLPDSEVKVIEEAIAEAYCGWSDAQRRSIWYETDSGMTDDDILCDASFGGIGHVLEVEMLDEVTRSVWQDADELRNGRDEEIRAQEDPDRAEASQPRGRPWTT